MSDHTVLTLESVHDLDKLPGELVPENPVKWFAYKALGESFGDPVDVVIRIREAPEMENF